MKTIRKFVRNPVFVFAMCSTMLLFSCGKDSVRPSINQFSGKDLMTAIYFLDGEALNVIEPLRDLRLEDMFKGAQITEIRGKVSSMLDEMEREKPGTFQSFKAKMTSGDQLVISDAIAENAEALLAYLKSNDEIKDYMELVQKNEKPLATLIDSHFPEKDSGMSVEELKSSITSETFKSDFKHYFDNLDNQLSGKVNGVEQDVCVTFAAAVIAVAAIAIAVIYAITILNIINIADVIEVIWQEESFARQSSSLMKEQIVNSVATNWKGV